jgi:hypothetical protein
VTFRNDHAARGIFGLLKSRLSRAAEARPPMLGTGVTITIRLSDPADEAALERFAQLSGRQMPSGRFLAADVDGELWAALPLSGGEALADPFLPALEVKELLALRAAQLETHAASLEPDVRLARLDDRLVVPRSLVEPR